MTITDHATAPTTDAEPPTLAEAYSPVPSVPRLIADISAETFLTSYAKARGQRHFHPEYVADRERTALLLRAVIADMFALIDPNNTHAAADAATAANRYRLSTRCGALPADAARASVREAFDTWENSEAPHPPNCDGGCGGTGEVLEILIYQDDGTPLHQEPVQCLRGESQDPHPYDCICGGTGTYWNSWEQWVCTGYEPRPLPEPSTADPNDPWSHEPPF